MNRHQMEKSRGPYWSSPKQRCRSQAPFGARLRWVRPCNRLKGRRGRKQFEALRGPSAGWVRFLVTQNSKGTMSNHRFLWFEFGFGFVFGFEVESEIRRTAAHIDWPSLTSQMASSCDSSCVRCTKNGGRRVREQNKKKSSTKICRVLKVGTVGTVGFTVSVFWELICKSRKTRLASWRLWTHAVAGTRGAY